MHKIGISKERLDRIMPSESFEWPISADEFVSKFAVEWTGNNLKEIQEFVGRDRATMLVFPRLVIHSDDGPKYPEIGDCIVKIGNRLYIDHVERS